MNDGAGREDPDADFQKKLKIYSKRQKQRTRLSHIIKILNCEKPNKTRLRLINNKTMELMRL